MTNIIERIRALEVRANAIRQHSFVQVLCSNSGWSGYINNLRLTVHELPDPHAALDALDAALAKIEDRDGALARTLGIAA